jgi:hypothetical protein
MQKSTNYRLAMMAVIDDRNLSRHVKPEVIAQLLEDEKLAKWSEERNKEDIDV